MGIGRQATSHTSKAGNADQVCYALHISDLFGSRLLMSALRADILDRQLCGNKRHRVTLLERENTLPVILHANDGPALTLRLVVQRLREGADLGVR
jgi:hypothetical protein